MLLASLGTSIANVGLPSLAQAFNASFAQVQWVVLAYLLAITTLVVSVGRLGDLLGRRRLLLAGIAVFTAASALCGAAPTLGLLLAARALQGLGAAAMMALTLAFVADTVAKERTGRAMGLLGTMSAVGTALGPSLGGMLIAAFGWEALFRIHVPLGLLAGALAYRSLPADRPRPATTRAGLDPAGMLLLALALGAYAGAMTLRNGALLAAAAVGTGLFVWVESRTASPLVRLDLLRAPGLRASLVMALLVTAVVMATLVVGPFYLSQALRLDAAQVGWVLSIGPCAAALGGVPAGRLVDHWGAPRMVVAGLSVMAAGSMALGMAPLAWGIAGYGAPVAVLTLGYALFQTANNTAALATTAATERGVVSGMLNLSRNLGLITGASAMGAVFASAAAHGDTSTAAPEAIAHGMQVTFAVATVLIGVALVCAVLVLWRRPAAGAEAPPLP